MSGGDRLLGNAMERGALGSELHGNPAERRAIWSREDSRFLDIFMASTPFFNYDNVVFCLYTAVGSTVTPRTCIATSFSHDLCFRA